MLHKNISPAERHAPWSWVFASEAEREAASGFVESDVSKLALQLSDSSAWVLTSPSPIVWAPISSGSGGGSSGGSLAVKLRDTSVLPIPVAALGLAVLLRSGGSVYVPLI